MTLRWTPTAVADLETIGDFIADDKPEASLKTLRSILSRIEDLKRFPELGRKGREGSTRELVLARLPYIVIYRVVGEVVEILSVHHGAWLR